MPCPGWWFGKLGVAGLLPELAGRAVPRVLAADDDVVGATVRARHLVGDAREARADRHVIEHLGHVLLAILAGDRLRLDLGDQLAVALGGLRARPLDLVLARRDLGRRPLLERGERLGVEVRRERGLGGRHRRRPPRRAGIDDLLLLLGGARVGLRGRVDLGLDLGEVVDLGVRRLGLDPDARRLDLDPDLLGLEERALERRVVRERRVELATDRRIALPAERLGLVDLGLERGDHLAGCRERHVALGLRRRALQPLGAIRLERLDQLGGGAPLGPGERRQRRVTLRVREPLERRQRLGVMARPVEVALLRLVARGRDRIEHEVVGLGRPGAALLDLRARGLQILGHPLRERGIVVAPREPLEGLERRQLALRDLGRALVRGLLRRPQVDVPVDLDPAEVGQPAAEVGQPAAQLVQRARARLREHLVVGQPGLLQLLGVPLDGVEVGVDLSRRGVVGEPGDPQAEPLHRVERRRQVATRDRLHDLAGPVHDVGDRLLEPCLADVEELPDHRPQLGPELRGDQPLDRLERDRRRQITERLRGDVLDVLGPDQLDRRLQRVVRVAHLLGGAGSAEGARLLRPRPT